MVTNEHYFIQRNDDEKYAVYMSSPQFYQGTYTHNCKVYRQLFLFLSNINLSSAYNTHRKECINVLSNIYSTYNDDANLIKTQSNIILSIFRIDIWFLLCLVTFNLIIGFFSVVLFVWVDWILNNNKNNGLIVWVFDEPERKKNLSFSKHFHSRFYVKKHYISIS